MTQLISDCLYRGERLKGETVVRLHVAPGDSRPHSYADSMNRTIA